MTDTGPVEHDDDIDDIDFAERLTITEAADALHVTRRTLYRYIRSGKLAGFRHGGHTYVARRQIREYFARLEAEGDAKRLRSARSARRAS